MKIILIVLLVPFYLFGYACENGEESIRVNGISIKSTDKRFGYKDLDCESVYIVYTNYAKNKTLQSFDINDTKEMIISKRELFDLKKEDNVTTLLVDVTRLASISEDYRTHDDVYKDKITNKVYYPLSFNKDGEYIVNEKRKKVSIVNDTDTQINLNDLLENTKWFSGDKKKIEANNEVKVNLTDSIDIHQKSDLKRYIKISQEKNKIVLSKQELKYKFLPPKIQTIDEPTIPTELIFDKNEYKYKEKNNIESIKEFKKFNTLIDNKSGHLTGKSQKLCIEDVKFKDNTYSISLKYCKVYKNKLLVDAGKYDSDFDEKKLSLNYKEGLAQDKDDITHIDKNIEMEIVLDNDAPFTFNNDNKNKQERKKKITFTKNKEQKIKVYPTYEYKTIKFTCEMQEFDTNGGKFREKKKKEKDTRTELTLDNTTLVCGESKKKKFDKKDNIKDFIANTKGFGECSYDGKNALCLENRLKLYIAYVPYSKSQFIENTKDTEISMKKIERFLKKVKKVKNQKLYVKNTDKLAYQFSEYFEEPYKERKHYNNIDIRNNIDTLFNVEGDINILYFSKLPKPELKNHFCKSKFKNKVVVFNFYENMDGFTCGQDENRLKIIDIADNLPISDSDLEKKLDDSIDEIQKFLEGK